MIGYNILCAIGALIGVILFCGNAISLFSIASLIMLLFFYAFFAIGFFPSYWSFIRDLKERVGIVVMNSSIIIVLFAIVNLIDNIIKVGNNGLQFIGAAMGSSAIMNILLPIILISSFMWLGLFLYTIWCGESKFNN